MKVVNETDITNPVHDNDLLAHSAYRAVLSLAHVCVQCGHWIATASIY